MRNSCWGPSSADGSCHPPRAWENGRASGRGEACAVVSEAGCCFMSACQGSLVVHRIANGKAHLGRGLQGVQMHVHVSLERPVPAVTCLLRGACGPLLGQRGRAWTVRSASYFPDSAPAQASAKTVRLRGQGPAAAPVAWARSLCLAPQLARRPLISPRRLCAGLSSWAFLLGLSAAPSSRPTPCRAALQGHPLAQHCPGNRQSSLGPYGACGLAGRENFKKLKKETNTIHIYIYVCVSIYLYMYM